MKSWVHNEEVVAGLDKGSSKTKTLALVAFLLVVCLTLVIHMSASPTSNNQPCACKASATAAVEEPRPTSLLHYNRCQLENLSYTNTWFRFRRKRNSR